MSAGVLSPHVGRDKGPLLDSKVRYNNSNLWLGLRRATPPPMGRSCGAPGNDAGRCTVCLAALAVGIDPTAADFEEAAQAAALGGRHRT